MKYLSKHHLRWRNGNTALVIMLILLLAPTLTPVASANTAQRCFAETGYCIEGRFLEYWEQNGGLPIFGYPLGAQASKVNREDGRTYTVQWFERSRFELHPENTRPYDVLLGRVGDDALLLQDRNWWVEGREPGPKDGCLWFEYTGHNICDVAPGLGFLSYWQRHSLHGLPSGSYNSSLALFGLPLTEAKLEINPDSGQPIMTQWFERARFEYHNEQPAGNVVLLGLLGNDLLGRTTPRYLWPGALPHGLVVQPQDAHADNGGFTIVLTQPGGGQPDVRINGGYSFFSPPPRVPGVPVTVRGKSGGAYTLGGVTFITWGENDWPYTISGSLSQQELLAFADGLELLPLARWQERKSQAM